MVILKRILQGEFKSARENLNRNGNSCHLNKSKRFSQISLSRATQSSSLLYSQECESEKFWRSDGSDSTSYEERLKWRKHFRMDDSERRRRGGVGVAFR